MVAMAITMAAARGGAAMTLMDKAGGRSVGILTDGYVHTNPLPQIPTKQSVPASRECLPGYFRIPIVIPTLPSLIRPAISKV